MVGPFLSPEKNETILLKIIILHTGIYLNEMCSHTHINPGP
jgi:hypothetical protein